MYLKITGIKSISLRWNIFLMYTQDDMYLTQVRRPTLVRSLTSYKQPFIPKSLLSKVTRVPKISSALSVQIPKCSKCLSAQ